MTSERASGEEEGGDRRNALAAAEPRDPAFFHDPFRHYALAHAAAPSFHWAAYGHRCFSAHADVSALLRDRRFGREPLGGPPAPREGLEAFDALERHSMLEREPPVHTLLRRAVNRSFVSRRIAGVRPFVERRAAELVAAVPCGEPFDLLPALATPLPVETIATVLGVPLRETERLLAWSHAMVAVYAFGDDGHVRRRANDASAAFGAFIREHLARIRRKGDAAGGTGVLADLVADRALSEEDRVSTAILLLNAGHEATVHQIGNAVLTLLDARGCGLDLAWWIADDARLGRLVEECLRYRPPLHLFTRTACEDVDWTDADGRNVPIRAGETIGLLLGAANRDPRRFPEPDRFDPTRERVDHVAFGGGIHFCLGAPLARMEIAVALRALFTRHPKLTLAAEPTVADTFHFHGLERLLVTTG